MANIITRRGEPSEALAGTWDPLRMRTPFGAMDPFRMLRDIMSGDPFAGMVQATSAMFMPDVEIKESKDSYAIKIDLPGVDEEDVEVSITGNRLTVSGRREQEDREQDDRFFVYERSYGAFSRSFTLPEGVDPGNIKAELKNGVLHITVPKRAEVQPRRIDVGGKQGGAREIEAKKQPEKTEKQLEKIEKQPEKKAA